jgi:hypothetical protein
MTIVITIAAVVFVFLDEFMGRTAPPLDEGERVVALQSWDAEAHRRREVSRRDLERWGATLQSVEDLGGFQTSRAPTDRREPPGRVGARRRDHRLGLPAGAGPAALGAVDRRGRRARRCGALWW